MANCKECLNRVPVISENGIHYNCGLPEDKTMECISGKEDHSLIFNFTEALNGTDRETT